MAHDPSSPNLDGTAHLAVLTEYADWNCDVDPPQAGATGIATASESATATAATETARATETAAPAPSSAWARWLARQLVAELERQLRTPNLPPGRQKKLAEALAHVRTWR